MHRSRSTLAAFALLVLAACAGMTVTPANENVDDAAALGVRYYGNSPYLLVHTDGGGGLVAELKYLPDPAKKMSARPYNYLASNATTLEFTNGVLTSSSVEADSTVVPMAVLGALKDLAVATVKVGMGAGLAGGQPQAPLPMLFKIVADDTGVHLWGPDGEVTPPATLPDGLHINKAKE